LGAKMVLAGGGVLGAGTVAPTEYVVTRLKAGYLLDDRFDPSGNIHAAELTLGLRSPRVGTKRRIMYGADHDMSNATIQTGRMHPHQHFIIPGHRPLNVPAVQDFNSAVHLLDDGLTEPTSTSSSRRRWDPFWSVFATGDREGPGDATVRGGRRGAGRARGRLRLEPTHMNDQLKP
jgi:hypothetical protein